MRNVEPDGKMRCGVTNYNYSGADLLVELNAAGVEVEVEVDIERSGGKNEVGNAVERASGIGRERTCIQPGNVRGRD